MPEQERSVYWNGPDSYQSKEHEGISMNQYGMRKRPSMVLFHVMIKRPDEEVGRSQQIKSERAPLDGRRDVFICYQGLLNINSQ